MRRSLLIGVCAATLAAAPALAADLSRPVYTKAPPPPVPVFSWTGIYIGANIGGAWTRDSVTDTLTGATFSTDNSGFIGGGQVGVNYQFSNFVIGAEWDMDGTSLSKTSPTVLTPIGALQASTHTDWIMTLTGRAGLAFDRWLVYAKGGGAWVQDSATLANLTTGASITGSNTSSGWTVGVGAEWAFAPAWSAKLEYDFVRLDNNNFNTLPGDTLTFNRDINLVKAGVNYRFNWFGGGY